MSNNPDSDEWDERYEAVREATEEDLKEEMHMQTVHFWPDQFDNELWNLGYWSGQGLGSYYGAAVFSRYALDDTFGGALYQHIKKEWELTGKPVAVQMGWLP